MSRPIQKKTAAKKLRESRSKPVPKITKNAVLTGVMTHGAIRAAPSNPTQARRFEWVVKKGKYFRPRCTPGNGPPFLAEAGERWMDLGANMGYFALAVLDKGAAFVTCVEAEKSNAVKVQENLALNDVEARAEVVRALVQGRPSAGPALLQLSEKTTRHAAQSFFVKKPAGDTQEVPCTATLRELLVAGTPYDAVKINIEGAERDVLLNTDASTWGAVRKMVVEYSFDVFRRRSDYDELLGHLKATGWRVHAESIPKWFQEPQSIWDTSMTRGNDARQIWAFRSPSNL